jgi:hypothetical protein
MQQPEEYQVVWTHTGTNEAVLVARYETPAAVADDLLTSYRRFVGRFHTDFDGNIIDFIKDCRLAIYANFQFVVALRVDVNEPSLFRATDERMSYPDVVTELVDDTIFVL